MAKNTQSGRGWVFFMKGEKMPAAKYDKSSVKAIALHGKLLIGKSLSEVVELPNDILNLADKRNKSNLGKLVEKFHFEHEPPNDDAPDFVEAELELKVTGAVRDGRRKDGESYKAKERLVLKNIHFGKIQQEVWEKSSIKLKCQKMLLLFYLYEKETPAIHRAFVLEPMVSAFPGTNLDKNDLELNYGLLGYLLEYSFKGDWFLQPFFLALDWHGAAFFLRL